MLENLVFVVTKEVTVVGGERNGCGKERGCTTADDMVCCERYGGMGPEGCAGVDDRSGCRSAGGREGNTDAELSGFNDRSM